MANEQTSGAGAAGAGAAAVAAGGLVGSGAGGNGTSGGRRHVYLCALRWSDMDSYGHVNNMIYLQYLEQARVDWMVATANRAGVHEFELGTVVARHTIEYKRPLVYRPEPVRVETWVTEIGHGSFTVAYEVKDDDYVYATAESTLVPFDLRESRLRRLTPTERGYLEQYLIKSPERGGLPPGAARFGLGVPATDR